MAISAQTTQSFVPIKEIRDGVVTLKNGGLRGILMASSINLSLKSEDEQRAVIMMFQAFLNSLDFPVQIVVQSRRFDIQPYLLTLEKREKEQTEPLLKIQTREYITFIRTFTEEHDVMTKNFFIIIPYENLTAKATGLLPKFGKISRSGAEDGVAANFEEQRTQLWQRISVVQQGLARVGVRAVPLGTEEVVELFYKTFNPGEVVGLSNVESGPDARTEGLQVKY